MPRKPARVLGPYVNGDTFRPLGRPRTGKTRLRIDEAHQLCAVLLEHAATDVGAVVSQSAQNI